jgi:hypothetical protein
MIAIGELEASYNLRGGNDCLTDILFSNCINSGINTSSPFRHERAAGRPAD